MIKILLKKQFENYKGLPSLAWQGLLISLIESSLIGICYFLSLYFTNELHINIAYSGVIMAFYGAGTIIGSTINGRLSDHISPNKISIANLIVQALAFLMLTRTYSLYWLMANLFIIGFASYGFITSNYTWVLSQCSQGEAQRLKAINLLNVASNLGLGISAIIIGLFETKTFSTILFISSILLFLAAIYLGFVSLLEKKSQSLKHVIQNDSSNNNVSVHRSLVLFSLVCLSFSGFIISQTSSTYSIYLTTIFPEMGITSFSILSVINTFMVVVLQTTISSFFSKKNKILTIGMGVFMLGFGMFLLSFAYAFIIAIFACIIMTLGEMIFFSISFLVCYEQSDANKKGQGIGTYRMIFALSRIIGPLMGGFIYNRFGAAMLWYFCGLVGLIGLGVSLIYYFSIKYKNNFIFAQ